MVQVLGRRQTANEVVTVASVVAGALDLGQVGHLVEHSGGLVLSVAGTAQSREAREEQRAVDHLAGGGVGVGQDTVGAGAQDVSAVVPAVAAGGGAALGGDVVEDCGDGVLDRGSGGLEVLGHLRVVGLGVGRSRAGQRCAVAKGGGGCGAAGAGAVGLNDCALGKLLVVAADLTGLLTVDSSLDTVADEGNGTSDLSRVKVGVGESTLGENLVVATSTQVMSNGDIEGCLDGLASSENLESRLLEVLGADAETETIEGNLLLGLEDLNFLDVRVVEESTSLEELKVLRSGVLDQSLHCGVAGEFELNVEWRVVKGEAGNKSGQSGERQNLNLHDR